MDIHSRQFEELISQTEDPVQRGTLIALETIATEFRLHRETFDTHAANEDRRWSSIRGAWWAFGIIMVAAQTAVGAMVARYVVTSDDQELRLARLERQVHTLEYACLRPGNGGLQQ